MTRLDGDYATLERLAIYLEAGWSDFLFDTPTLDDRATKFQYPNPLFDRVPPDFFRTVAALARNWAAAMPLDPKSLCDVGGGTGRAIYELDASFPGLERLVLIEPSARFCEWARRLLFSGNELPEIPSVDRTGSPRWVAAKSRPPAIPSANRRLTVANMTLECYESQAAFDLVTCLNVVDRHSCPQALIRELSKLLKHDGLLILSSPLDFHEESTPDRGSWTDDLNSLFEDAGAWSHVAEEEVFYEYRSFNRSWTRFSSQIVGKRWRSKKA